MQLIPICSSLFLLTLLTACSSKSSADELAKELQTVTSWAATAHMVGDAWTRGVVPTAYAKQTLEKAQKELHKEIDKLTQKSDPQDRATLQEQLRRLESTVGQMSTAVEQGNRTALAKLVADIAQQLKQLSREEQTISTLAKTAGG